MEERKIRKQQVGEKKTPFAKLNINKNQEDSDSIEDPDDSEGGDEDRKYTFSTFERPNVRALGDQEIINEVVDSIRI